MTNKTIPCNSPHITPVEKFNKTAFLINIADPNTHNLMQSHTEKLSEYTGLAEAIRKQWRMKAVPIVVSSLGIISKSLQEALQPLHLSPGTFLQLQKAAILSTCHIT